MTPFEPDDAIFFDVMRASAMRLSELACPILIAVSNLQGTGSVHFYVEGIKAQSPEYRDALAKVFEQYAAKIRSNNIKEHGD
jgi:hypothetical protein